MKLFEQVFIAALLAVSSGLLSLDTAIATGDKERLVLITTNKLSYKPNETVNVTIENVSNYKITIIVNQCGFSSGKPFVIEKLSSEIIYSIELLEKPIWRWIDTHPNKMVSCNNHFPHVTLRPYKKHDDSIFILDSTTTFPIIGSGKYRIKVDYVLDGQKEGGLAYSGEFLRE